ncbi:MAG: hypothetical protein GY810_12290 [Aureispira sp.]|nr:hypothetical protein [Aureispira sp.]
MRTYLFILLIALLVQPAYSQGYEQWKASQKSTTHLQAPYKIKKAYWSPSGKKSDFYLKQYQEYNEQGRMFRDVLYRNRMEQVYDITIKYKDSTTARSFNKVDTSTAIYKFSKSKKITYYLTEDVVGLFINYKYDSLDRLESCKDCMAPFGNAVQCAYYQYIYDGNDLVKIKQSSVSKVQLAEAGQLYATDSLVYQVGLLSTKYFMDATKNELVHKNLYRYNKKGRCVELIEHRGIDREGKAAQLWTTSYRYRLNGALCRSESQQLLLGDSTATKSIKTRYNRKGLKIAVHTKYLKDGSQRRFKFEYKE